jgi:hypothetical protein
VDRSHADDNVRHVALSGLRRRALTLALRISHYKLVHKKIAGADLVSPYGKHFHVTDPSISQEDIISERLSNIGQIISDHDNNFVV